MVDKIEVKNHLNYYYIVYKINIPPKKKKIKKKLGKFNFLYLTKISMCLKYSPRENIFPNFKILHYHLKSSRYIKLIIYKIKDYFIINLIKLQRKNKKIIDRVNFYIKIFINIYNIKEDKVTLVISNSRFKLNRINPDYIEIFNNINYKSCNKKIKGIRGYKNYTIFFKIINNCFIKICVYIYIILNFT